jgi:uncharacterized membrane protein
LRHLVAVGAIALLLVGIVSLIWGWPGSVGLLALAPGLVLGATLVHLVDAYMGLRPLRLTFVMLGILLGTFSSLAAMLVMVAANVPEEIVLETSLETDCSQEEIWWAVGEPLRWTRWDYWLGDLEPSEVQADGKVGRIYRSVVSIAGQQLDTRHHLTAFEPKEHFAWRIELPEGSALVDLRQRVDLEPANGAIHLRMRLAYRLPSILGRALHELMFRRSFEETLALSLQGLVELAQDKGNEQQ